MGFPGSKIYVELDGHFYLYESGQLEELVDVSDVSGEGILVSDFPGAISRLMQVDTGPKFAEVMARRRIQEEGEFDQTPAIISHWKRKKGKNSTEILITALPYQIYDLYLNRTSEAGEPVIIYCLYGVLHEILKRHAKKRPAALVFQHGRIADVVIGNARRLYFANRSMAFDESEEQIQSLWDMVLSDIKTTEAENKIKVEKVLFVSWIDSFSPQWRTDSGPRVETLPEEPLKLGENEYKASFLGAIRALSPGASISRPIEKWAFRASRSILGLNIIMVLAVTVMFSGHLYLSSKTGSLETTYNKLKEELVSVRQLHYTPKPISSYEATLSFLGRLYRASRLPALRALVNDLSGAFGHRAVIELVDAGYGESALNAEIRGKIAAPFAQAHTWYQAALGKLQQKGYAVEKSSFSTNISESHFMFRLVKRIK